MAQRPFLIDTHCHLDASEFDRDRGAVQADAVANGIGAIVIPAVAVANFPIVARLAHATVGGSYALGIHPLLTPTADEQDIATLRRAVAKAVDDPRFVAIGEIGLDLFVPSLTTAAAVARQTWFFDEQLKIARDFDLPVLLHVRRAQDQVLAGLRRMRRRPGPQGATGIAHAFNGSAQQAAQYLALGFRLGFGGASTFERALRIRALAHELPDEALVLETDAPDIAPAWVRLPDGHAGRNAPAELARIADVIATLRSTTVAQLALQTTRNALAVLPRLHALLQATTPRAASAAAPEITPESTARPDPRLQTH